MRYVICYDISSNDRRRRVSECLDGYGDRIQRSVFEAVLDAKLLKACLSELADLIDSDEDSIAAYALCASCDDRRVYRGSAEGRNIGDEEVYIV